MEKKLHLLESFHARGSDGKDYMVHCYEHLALVETLSATPDQWEPTGQIEYKLADGHLVHVDQNDQMTIADSDIRLERSKSAA
ncbi:hypothetical protein [Piscinibacter sakaiensis]|uniref:hypothetical protein n=1 Tax=Piscinibacter sakaiensis TaxID=1547922 RepID=UPI003AAE5AC7